MPRLIARFGSQRERWAKPSELQCYSGIAPVLESSGRQDWVHMRWACPKFLHQTFHEWAAHAVRKCSWAKTAYEAQIQRGKSRHAAIRAVAFKMAAYWFRCWKDRRHYDPALYQHSGPITPSAGSELGLQWKPVDLSPGLQ